MLTRRRFLQYSATLFAATRAGQLVAQTGSAPQVLWMQLFATGGWDQMLFCDPKLGVRASNGGAHTSAGQVLDIGGITYVNTSAAVNTFFTTHASRLLVINGIDTGTNNHEVGVRYCMTGSTLEGFPVFAAQVAGALGKTQAMPLINISGYDEGGGLLAPVRLDYMGIPQMARVQHPNQPACEYDAVLGYPCDRDGTYLAESARSLVQSAHLARLERQAAAARLPAHKRAINALQIARGAAERLPEVQLPQQDTDLAENYRRLITMGVRSFKSGLATSINVATGDCDSHGIADTDHLAQLGRVLDLANHAVATADANEVPIVVVMSSDFGRTPVREGAGSGHWPICSMLLLQNERAKALQILPAGKTIGATTGSARENNANLGTVLQARKMNLATHALGDTGHIMTPAHVFAALRRAAGVEEQLRAFPLAVEGGDLALV